MLYPLSYGGNALEAYLADAAGFRTTPNGYGKSVKTRLCQRKVTPWG